MRWTSIRQVVIIFQISTSKLVRGPNISFVPRLLHVFDKYFFPTLLGEILAGRNFREDLISRLLDY